jgi:hypothetical protein
VGLSTTPLGSIGIDRKEPSSPTTVAEFPAELSKGLQKLLPYIDQEAIALLWTDCRARANDCSPDEILNFVRLKGSIALNGRINNPVGFLLRAVPKCFEGRGFQEFREEQERRREAARNQDTAEKERSRQMQEEAVREETAYQQAKGKLNSLPREQYESLENRAKADVEGRFSRFVGGAPQTLRELIEQKMVELLRAEEEAKVG